MIESDAISNIASLIEKSRHSDSDDLEFIVEDESRRVATNRSGLPYCTKTMNYPQSVIMRQGVRTPPSDRSSLSEGFELEGQNGVGFMLR